MNPEPKYHVLLVGVDAYSSKPLRGCVNDIDAVQKLLLERAKIPADRITRLASPHPGDVHDETLSEQPASLENIRAALARLGSDAVGAGDRVVVYYSGHGARVPIFGPTETVFCESLVPVDFNTVPGQPRLLPDHEFNQLLAAVARRTRAVTVVLDCCHSAGATRELAPGPDVATRSLSVPEDFGGRPDPLKLDPAAAPPPGGAAAPAGVDDCLVAAACLNHELAQETAGTDGVHHGLLSRALTAELAGVPEADLRAVPWARVWQRMRAAVEGANPSQHLWLAGSPARAVLGGPPVDGDPGFPIAPAGNAYQVEAGTLADVGVGAGLAVYGERPAVFPPVGSAADLAARVGTVLTVTRADRATATAAPGGAPFALPAGARARLVAPGAAERVGVAVVVEGPAAPPDPQLVAGLNASPFLQVVDETQARARLEHRADGRWYLTDDVAGVVPGYLRAGQPAGSHAGEFPPLAVFAADHLGRARDLLEVYARYSLPLRMATRCTDLPGQLKVRFLSCPNKIEPAATAETADLPELRRHKALTYAVAAGDGFCVHVHNASMEMLRVVLVNCSETGQVEFLADQTVNPMAGKRFWLLNNTGEPFKPQPGAGGPYLNRMVVFGTTRLDRDLSFLQSGATFADALDPPRGDKGLLGGARAAAPADKWTATEVQFGVGIPGAV
jgi:hypothetical protein